jgi:hypothetical protein
MRYLMLVCVGEGPPSPEQNAELSVDPWVEEMDGRGVRIDGSPLRPARDARTVRVRQGEVIVSDGPFAETKEQVGGYDLLDCADLDEAIEVASKHPVARFGTLDLRPLATG